MGLLQLKKRRKCYESTRGIPLVWNGDVCRDWPVLTVESYVKWYDLYVVEAGGKVRGLLTDCPEYAETIRNVENQCNGMSINDHIINPAFFRNIAQELHLFTDEAAYDMILGRWVQYHE